MQYYVIGPDGNKYGPADVPTLKQWVAENRLNQGSMLEDFNTGQRVTAGQVPGLFDVATAAAPGPNMGPAVAPGPYAQAPMQGTVYTPGPGGAVSSDNGKTWIIVSWICSAVGLTGCCFYIFSILGIVFAFVGGAKGATNSMAPKIFGFVSLVVGIAISIATRAALMEFVRQLQQNQPHQ